MQRQTTGVESLPAPRNENESRLLHVVWLEAFGDSGWPTFRAVDQRLDQYGIDAVEVLRRFPAHLLVGWPDRNRAVPAPDAPLQVTIAGAAHCPGTADVVDAFIALARTLADMEKHWPVGSPSSLPGPAAPSQTPTPACCSCCPPSGTPPHRGRPSTAWPRRCAPAYACRPPSRLPWPCSKLKG